MAAALVELLVLVGALTSFRFVAATVVPVPFMGATMQTTGYTICDERHRPVVTLATLAESLEATLLHELAHAHDCLDNGVVDGSLLPSGATLAPPAILHCTANRAEYYACWVTEQAHERAASAAHLAEPVRDPPPETANLPASRR